MKYIIERIVNEVKDKVKSPSEEVMIKIDCFNSLKIYNSVALKLEDLFKNKNFDFRIKLSQKTFSKLKQKLPEGDSVILSIQNHDWIASDQSLTYYRNLHDKKILILMGTENEDDTGGLANIFEISPSYLNKLLQGRYYNVFKYTRQDLEKDDELSIIINSLYKELFCYVPVDIVHLSSFADEIGTSYDTVDDFCQIFFSHLPEWGLPLWERDYPDKKTIKNKNSFLKNSYGFISRSMFAQTTASKIAKIEKQLNAYDEANSNDAHPYNSDWNEWKSQNIKSYKEFEKTLLDFVKGKDADSNRTKLLKLDYAIVQSVLDLKLKKEGKKTDKKILKVYGEPLIAIFKAVLEVLATVKNNIDRIDDEYGGIDEIKVEFDEANLLSSYSEMEDDDGKAALIETWKNFCRHTNGIVDYINQCGNFGIEGENELRITSYPQDFLSPLSAKKYCDDNRVKPLNGNKFVSTLSFKICCYNKGKKIDINILNQECLWSFSDDSSWLNNFSKLCNEYDYNESGKDFYVPLSTIGKINPLIFAKSNDEFMDLLNESKLDFSYNICDKFSEPSEKPMKSEFLKLGKSFSSFVEQLCQNGLYSALLEHEKLDDLIENYNSLGEKLQKTQIAENEKWVLESFIHSFLIEKDANSLKGNEPDCCILPPWHPATLQRILDRQIFIADGCNQWWNSNSSKPVINKGLIPDEIDHLDELSKIQGSIDIMPYKKEYYGVISSFGEYSVYGKSDLKNTSGLKDIIKKDAIFDDDFAETGINKMNDDAWMFFGIYKNYCKAFPNADSDLSLAFINPADLQPIVASIYQFVKSIHDDDPQKKINVTLKILVKPENRGGRNYLAFWMNEFFSEDENTSIKTYLNEWKTSDDLRKLLYSNNDIAFVMNFMQENSLDFLPYVNNADDLSQCRFPIIYKPSPVSETSTETRRIDISQPQFSASFTHTQVVRYRNNLEDVPNKKYIAVKETKIDEDGEKLVSMLHEKAYWVVCIDSGLDNSLLRHIKGDFDYSIIGFSTGKGQYGKYSVTITARKSIIDVVEKKLSNRLHQLFHWEDDKIKQATKHCMDEAGKLDGISLFSAMNPKDQNIREFMAYVMTSLREREKKDPSPLKILIHLDSYKHWFDQENENGTNKFGSRPDFLLLSVHESEDSLSLDAHIIECKISCDANLESHKKKALMQVKNGIEVLKAKFNPHSASIERRFWYSQLYKALVFSQISFINNSSEFQKLSAKLRQILDGKFDINWYGDVLCYMLESASDEESVTQNSESDDNGERVDPITIYDIPQLRMQSLLLGEKAESFSDIDNPDAVDDDTDEEQDEEEEEQDDSDEEIEKKPDDFTVTNPSTHDTPIVVETKPDPVVIVTPVNPNPVADDIVVNNPTIDYPLDLTKARVLIGSSKFNGDLYWEFGNKSLSNRHLLITGTSGQGKTYCIQTLLYELSKSNVSSVIFDYTEGFKPDQLEPEFTSKMKDKVRQYVIYSQGVPINPFVCHEIELAGSKVLEKPADVAGRIADIFTHVYKFGDQQQSAIFNAVYNGIKKYKNKMDMMCFKKELELLKSENPAAKTVLSKMDPFFMTIEFNEDPEFNWNNILYSKESSVMIFQLMNIAKEMQVIVTELMLWDAWYFTKKFGNKDKPFAVILDEAQNLSHKENSPSAKILTEGRKFGWSAWFATQSLDILENDEVTRLMQSAVRIYFKPTDSELTKVSKLLDPQNGPQYLSSLKSLKKGECVVSGERMLGDGTVGGAKPTIVQVTSFEKRS